MCLNFNSENFDVGDRISKNIESLLYNTVYSFISLFPQKINCSVQKTSITFSKKAYDTD